MGEIAYLKGEEALRARAALARLLLAGPLGHTLARMLAAVFGPEPESLSIERAFDRGLAGLAALQTVDFKRRSNKRSAPWNRDETVGSWMQDRLDDGTATSIKHAQTLAMEKFSLTPSVVKDVWLEWLQIRRSLALHLRYEEMGSWMRRRLDDKSATSIEHAQTLAMEKFSLTPGEAEDVWLEWLDLESIRARMRRSP